MLCTNTAKGQGIYGAGDRTGPRVGYIDIPQGFYMGPPPPMHFGKAFPLEAILIESMGRVWLRKINFQL